MNNGEENRDKVRSVSEMERHWAAEKKRADDLEIRLRTMETEMRNQMMNMEFLIIEKDTLIRRKEAKIEELQGAVREKEDPD